MCSLFRVGLPLNVACVFMLVSMTEGGIDMSNQCDVRELPAQLVLAIRTRTTIQDLPQFLGRAYGAIAEYLAELGQHPAGARYAAYYNMDMQNLDVEGGFPVSVRLPDKGEIKSGEMPGGKVATCFHLGPNSDIGAAWDALAQWVKDNGHDATGVAYEIYWNDPAHTPPQELRTQLVLPVK